MFDDYVQRYERREVQIGRPYLYRADDHLILSGDVGPELNFRFATGLWVAKSSSPLAVVEPLRDPQNDRVLHLHDVPAQEVLIAGVVDGVCLVAVPTLDYD